MPATQNFFLWGTWGKRVIRRPFLTQKCDGIYFKKFEFELFCNEKIRKIWIKWQCFSNWGSVKQTVIGDGFIVSLLHDGTLQSWGEDKTGCLGLGNDISSVTEPRQIQGTFLISILLY